MRRASSRVSRLVAERRCDAAICPQMGDKRKSLAHARNDVNDPQRRFRTLLFDTSSARTRNDSTDDAFILPAGADCDKSQTMKLPSAIRRAFAVLAVAGLILAPQARLAMAMPSETQGTMSEHGATDARTAMGMPVDMPCCPDKAPASDCGKDCPLMALCTASVLQSAPLGVPLFIPLLAGIVIPGDDADLGSLAQAPPPRPPKA
jgi:hypothetical protein